MKGIRTSVAILLLVSTALSACSREESVQTEPSETTVATEVEDDREYLIDRLPNVTATEYYEDESWSDPVIPTEAYDFVVDSIIDRFDDPDAEKGAYPYIGWTDDSGIDEMIAEGRSTDDLAAAFVDVNNDGVCELLILDISDPVDFAIIEMYSYDSDFGIHPILHGNEQHRYYLAQYMTVYDVCTEPGSECICEYWFSWEGTLCLSSAIYVVEIDGVDHLCEAWSEEYIMSSDITSDNVYDYGPLPAYYDALGEISDDLYVYYDMIPLSDYRI